MSRECNCKVSSKNSKRFLKNWQNTARDYFFATPFVSVELVVELVTCISGACAALKVSSFYSCFLISCMQYMPQIFRLFIGKMVQQVRIVIWFNSVSLQKCIILQNSIIGRPYPLFLVATTAVASCMHVSSPMCLTIVSYRQWRLHDGYCMRLLWTCSTVCMRLSLDCRYVEQVSH